MNKITMIFTRFAKPARLSEQHWMDLETDEWTASTRNVGVFTRNVFDRDVMANAVQIAHDEQLSITISFEY